MPTVHLLVKGKVQGVFYRATAKKEATNLGITGWVKNTEQGTVELVVTGSEDALKLFITWCKGGPPGATVAGVEKTPLPEETFTAFIISR